MPQTPYPEPGSAAWPATTRAASVTDIVQIIGRALRRDPNRPDKIATVVVPIHHTDLDDDRQWQTVTNILRALRTFDATFTDQLNAATLHHHPNSSGASGLDKLVITGTHQLPDDLLDRIRTCIIDRASDPWLIRYRRVYDWTVTNGRTPNYSEPDGEWVSQQRTYYNAGRLADNRIAFMEQLPGWTWTPFEDSWQDQFGQVTAFFAEHGRLPTTAEPGGRWLSDQRSFKWTDRLRGDRHQVLDTALPPGWDQRKRADRWDTMFAAAEAFCQEHGHPPVYPYDTGELAIWVDDQKTLRRYPTSKSALSPERQQRLESLPGWTWDHPVDA